MNFNKHSFYIVVLLIFSIGLSCFWFRDKKIKASAESGIPFYNLQSSEENTHWAWSEYIVGGPSVYTTATNPSYAFLKKLNDFGLSGLYLEIGFFALSLFLPGIGIYLLSKLFFKNIDLKYVFLATLFYLGNPLSQATVWSRFLYNQTLFFATFPLFIYFFSRGLYDRNYKYAFIFPLFATLFVYSISAPAFVVVLWIAISLIAFVEFIFSKDKGFTTLYFFIALFAFLIYNSWWLSQVVVGYLYHLPKAQETKLFTSSGNVSSLRAISSIAGNLEDILRYAHASFGKNNASTRVIGYMFFALSSIGIVKMKKNKPRAFLVLGSLYIVSVIFMKGSNPPLGGIFVFLFKNVVLLQFLRNPFEKMSFLYILASTLSLSYVLGIFIKKKWMLVAFILLLFFWTKDFYTGDIFKTNYKGEEIDYSVTVPEDYKNINADIKYSDNRIFVLPFTKEGIATNWEDSYIGVEPSRDLLNLPAISLNTSIPFYTKIADNIFQTQRTDKVLNYLPYFNIEYVLLRKDLDYKSRGYPRYEDIRVNWNDLEKISDYHNLSLYRLPDEYSWGKIYLTDRLIVSDSSNLGLLSSMDSEFPSVKNGILDVDSLYTKVFANSDKLVVLEPKKYYSPLTPGSQDYYADQELVDSLVYTRYSPESKLYSLVLIKEYLRRPSEDDIAKRKRYDIDILAKRAVEYFKYNQLESTRDRYTQQLKKISHYKYLDVYSSNSLLYQYSLLSRVDVGLANELGEYMQSINLKPVSDLPNLTEQSQYLIYQFEIPEEGKYGIDFPLIKSIRKIYLNGNLTKLEENKMNLNSGFNEIAIEVPTRELEDNIFGQGDILVSRTDKYSKEVEIESGKSYVLKFDYRFIKGNSFVLQIRQDVDKLNFPLLRRVIDKNAFFHGSLLYAIEINPDIGANKLTIEMLPNEEKDDGRFESEITNLQLNARGSKKMFLLTGSINNSETSSILNWDKINPTQYRITISKKTETPELLVFSELFDDGWKIAGYDHLRVNGYANGWVINNPGEYTLDLKYKPQEYLDMFSYLSLFSILLSAGYLIFKRG